jgi:two-component system response regulator YesN
MYTLIIADDEYELRQALVKTVDWESIGFKVVGEAENGVEALEMVEKYEVDLLLTDIKMPFLSGIDLAREVRAIRPAVSIAFLSGYDDFAYAQQAIQYNILSYILKPISADELKTEMLKIKEKMDQKQEELVKIENPKSVEEMQEAYEKKMFLYGLLMENDRLGGNPVDESQLVYDMQLSHFKGEELAYVLQVTKLCDEQGDNRTRAAQLKLIDSVTGKYVNSISLYTNNRIITLIAGNPREMKKYMSIIPKEISQLAVRYMGLKAVIGISSGYDGIDHTYYAYQEAMDAMEYADRDESGVSIFSDYESGSSEEIFNASKVADELMLAIKTEPEEKVVSHVENIFRDVKQNSGLVTSQVVVAIYETVGNLLGEDAAGELMSYLYEDDGKYEYIMKKRSQSEITKLAVKARTMIQEQRQANSKLLCDEAIKIIDSEYGDEGLSLAYVSDKLHVSVSYLSTLIKKVSGKSFVTLLTDRRMQAAKELILYSQKKMIAIAEECGYSDNHYFSYSFKKYFGVSPRKMRETVKNAET